MKRIAIFIGLIFNMSIVFAQGELLEDDNIFYKNERTFAVIAGSNGFGINYRYAKRITALRKVIYDFDFAGIKHPKEIKLSSVFYSFSSRSFVYGKLNQFYALRIGIGLQDELFPKADKGGISIRSYYTFGPSLGIKKPIYYLYGIDQNGDTYPEYEVIEKFEYSQHVTAPYILGRASFFKGFNEITVAPGLYGKAGMMFEFGKFNQTIHAIDAGMVIDAYLQKIPIMDVETNSRIFLTLYVGYRFGKVIDAKYKMRRTGLDEIITD